MTRRLVIRMLGSALIPAALMPWALHAQSAGGKRSIDVAREIFARAVARSFQHELTSFRVLPVSDPSDVYSSLRFGDLYAWSAEAIGGKVFVNGFASAGADAAVAFEGCVDGLGNLLGLKALMKAMRVNQPPQRMPLTQIMPRVAFCLNRADLGEILFGARVMESSGFAAPEAVVEPSLRPQKSGQMLIYFTMIPGLTGTWEIWKITVSILADDSALIDRRPLV